MHQPFHGIFQLDEKAKARHTADNGWKNLALKGQHIFDLLHVHAFPLSLLGNFFPHGGLLGVILHFAAEGFDALVAQFIVLMQTFFNHAMNSQIRIAANR